MFNVVLVNMPYANPLAPSLALTQLESVLASELSGRVSCQTVYANQDFVGSVGLDAYRQISGGIDNLGTGLGEWFFRASAFPDLPDNADEYFQRYYVMSDDATIALKANILEQRGCLDQFLDDTVDRYGLDQADLVGFTSMFTQNLASVALARRVKSRNPNAITVLGGANCESPMGEEYARSLEPIDFVFSGPALINFPEFVTHLIEGNPDECHRIRGVYSKRNASVEVVGAARLGKELEIDVPVSLDFSDFFAALDRNFPNSNDAPLLHFETSRGCWWGQRAHCTFCGLNGSTMSYRSMSPDLAISQFESLFEYCNSYPDRTINLHSVDNILPTDYAAKVFPEIRPPKNTSLFYEVKASLAEEDFAALSRARVRTVQPGIEALATSTLKLMRKGTSVFQNLVFLKNCLNYGIKPEWNLLIGFPKEEEDVFRKYVEDIPDLLHLPPPGGAFPVRFDRFSPYFTAAEDWDLELKPYDFYNLVYPFPQSAIDNIAYYFMDKNFRAPYLKAQAKWIGKVAQSVRGWVERWSKDSKAISPKLYFVEGSECRSVYDSRSGAVELRSLAPLETQILGHLGEMRTVTKLGAALPGVPPSALEAAIDSLRKQGLVFEERKRFVGLVLPNDSQPWFAGDQRGVPGAL